MNVREYKGNSLISFPTTYTIVDLETTGFSPEYDYIIEVGAIKVSDNIIIDKFSSIVREPDFDYIDSFITDLTGITQEMIDSAPIMSDIFPKFLEFIGGDIIIGHNVNFDINFIYDRALFQFDKYFKNDFIDTMRLSRRLSPELHHHRLRDIANKYGISIENSHRATADCEITYNCYQRMQVEVIEKFGSIKEFIKICRPNHNIRSRDITPETNEFDTTNPIFGKTCVFTGKLERFTRKEAMQIVSNAGGINGDSVTKKTNFLILGNNDYCSSIKDGKSRKQKKAEGLKLSGQDIEIIPENVFYDMISTE